MVIESLRAVAEVRRIKALGGVVIGVENFKWIAILFLIIIGVILSAGQTVYGMMERITKTIIMIGVPFIFLLAVLLSTKTDWVLLVQGMIGRGDGYNFLPEGIILATFLAAFAYSGAGGNLNLTQSIYVKEKGYGMGKYSQKISGLFATKKGDEQIKLAGEDFELTTENISRFKQWWKKISLEHLFVFWFVGGLSMMLLMILAYTTTHGLGDNAEGIQFVINEGSAIGAQLMPVIGTLFLVVVSVVLFQTQLGVMDSTSRIMAENIAIARLEVKGSGKIDLSKLYSLFVWAQISFGVTLFLFNIYEPKSLIILGAVINAVAMFVHVGFVSYLNHKVLPKVFRPLLWRKIVMAGIFLFFGFFSTIVILDKI